MNQNSEYQPGDVVYFDHLHCNKRARRASCTDGDGKYNVEVEGKSRRMIIVGRCHRVRVKTARNTGSFSGPNDCVWYEAEAELGYLVLPLQSTRPPVAGEDFLPLEPGLIDEGKPSFVQLRLACYPVNSICHRIHTPVRHLDERHLKTIRDELNKLTHRSRVMWYPA
jgi:hypothetical protein